MPSFLYFVNFVLNSFIYSVYKELIVNMKFFHPFIRSFIQSFTLVPFVALGSITVNCYNHFIAFLLLNNTTDEPASQLVMTHSQSSSCQPFFVPEFHLQFAGWLAGWLVACLVDAVIINVKFNSILWFLYIVLHSSCPVFRGILIFIFIHCMLD